MSKNAGLVLGALPIVGLLTWCAVHQGDGAKAKKSDESRWARARAENDARAQTQAKANAERAAWAAAHPVEAAAEANRVQVQKLEAEQAKRNAEAARLEKAMLLDGRDATVKALGSNLYIDYFRCGRPFMAQLGETDIVASMKNSGFTQIVCRDTSGERFTLSL